MSRELELVTGAALADGRPGPRAAKAGDGAKHAALHTECLNCGAQLHGRYCADCGQASDDHHRSVFHLAWEAVEGLFHLDGRLARTIPPLFFKPGSLARDHFEGRRQRHVPPFRLFLVCLLIFMLALEFAVHHGGHPAVVTNPASHAATAASSTGEAAPPAASTASSAPAQALPPGFVAPAEPAAPEIEPAYRLAAPKDVEVGAAAQEVAAAGISQALSGSDNPLAKWFGERTKAAGINPEFFISTMFSWGHRLAILLLPIFALLLTACYFYKRRFYVYDHLVVSMQFLSFIFLVSAISWVLPPPLRDTAVLIATLWTPVNLYMLLRGAYGSSVIGAALKAFVLWISALFLFLFLLMGIVAVALGEMG